ncbi:MAG: class I SAM-dependent methyltransferase [Anaerolineae bacterium]|nr:class I SAM-dependent methyltransferase [Anaerolineae bacterium]
MWTMELAETNRVPDWLIRVALRVSLRNTLRRHYRLSLEERTGEKRALIQKLRHSPIAIHTADPNRQHYKVPTEFFRLVLGKRLKYSCCYWPEGVTTIDEAEEAMLRLTCKRARLEDGMDVLDLGCGWGSFCLWIAESYPHSHVVAVSNSHTQREYIEARCRERDLGNVKVITADMNAFQTERRFDRIVSIEMFEHMKNYELLLSQIASWLRPGGLLFVHIFSHREFAYEFDAGNPNDWMARHFFAGGMMPSDDLLFHFQRDLRLIDHWRLDGTHYARTLRAWLDRLDHYQTEVRLIMAQICGQEHEIRWLARWRLFFLICEEVWGLRRGQEYLVSHYLFDKQNNGRKAVEDRAAR